MKKDSQLISKGAEGGEEREGKMDTYLLFGCIVFFHFHFQNILKKNISLDNFAWPNPKLHLMYFLDLGTLSI